MAKEKSTPQEAEEVQTEIDGLGDMLEAEDKATADQAAVDEADEKKKAKEVEKASVPTEAEILKAQALASGVNKAFLFGVSKVICPSVDIGKIVNEQAGVDALTPLALELGGEIPPWAIEMYAKFAPYIAAGVYAGSTVMQCRKIELAVRAETERREDKVNPEQQKAEAEGVKEAGDIHE